MAEAIEVSDGSDTERDEAAVRRFVERFALTMVEAGVPRMPARVFAALLGSEHGRLTAAELAAALQVSPAAISGAVRYLLQVKLIVRVRDPGERRDHYSLPGSLWYETMTQRFDILDRWAADMKIGADAVGAGTPAADRLEETREFFEFLRDESSQLMEKWRVRRAGRS
jgi:DNA-binding transcriptional regulator GbsR (MarR family)